MSNITTLQSISDELTAALTVPELVTGMVVVPTMSFDDLMNHSSNGRLPALGIIYLNTEKPNPYAIGGKQFSATTKWRIAVAHQNLKSSAAARTGLYNIFGAIKDRVHYLQSNLSPKARYMFEAEAVLDNQPEGRVVGYVDFTLLLMLGN
jgi:hypothetical protein